MKYALPVLLLARLAGPRAARTRTAARRSLRRPGSAAETVMAARRAGRHRRRDRDARQADADDGARGRDRATSSSPSAARRRARAAEAAGAASIRRRSRCMPTLSVAGTLGAGLAARVQCIDPAAADCGGFFAPQESSGVSARARTGGSTDFGQTAREHPRRRGERGGRRRRRQHDEPRHPRTTSSPRTSRRSRASGSIARRGGDREERGGAPRSGEAVRRRAGPGSDRGRRRRSRAPRTRGRRSRRRRATRRSRSRTCAPRSAGSIRPRSPAVDPNWPVPPDQEPPELDRARRHRAQAPPRDRRSSTSRSQASDASIDAAHAERRPVLSAQRIDRSGRRHSDDWSPRADVERRPRRCRGSCSTAAAAAADVRDRQREPRRRRRRQRDALLVSLTSQLELGARADRREPRERRRPPPRRSPPRSAAAQARRTRATRRASAARSSSPTRRPRSRRPRATSSRREWQLANAWSGLERAIAAP